MRQSMLFLASALFLLAQGGCGGAKVEDDAVGAADAPAFLAVKTPLDLSYISADFAGAIIVRPRRIADWPALAPAFDETERRNATIRQNIDWRKIEQITILMPAVNGQSAKSSERSVGCFIVRLSKATDMAAVTKRLCDGRDVTISRAADERTLLLATPGGEKQIERMLNATDVESPLLTRLRAIDADNDLIVVRPMDAIKKSIERLAALQQEAVGPKDAATLRLAEACGYFTLVGNLRGEQLAAAVFDAADEEQAANAEQAVKDLHALLKTRLAEMRQELRPTWWDMGVPIVFEDLFPFPPRQGPPLVLDRVEEVVREARVYRDGNRVVAVARRTPALESTVRSLSVESKRQGENAARQARELERLQKISIAYRQSATLPRDITAENGGALLSWRVSILRELGEEGLYKKFRLDEPWDSPHNSFALKEMPKVFRAPGRPDDGKTSVLLCLDKSQYQAFPRRQLYYDDFDNFRNSIFFVEAGPEKSVPWTQPEDLTLQSQSDMRTLLGTIPSDGFLAITGYGIGHRMLDIDADSFRILTDLRSGNAYSPVVFRAQFDAEEVAARKAAGRDPHGRRLVEVSRAIAHYLRTNHSKQHWLAGFPPPAICGRNGKPVLSWRVTILPFLGQEALYKKFRLDEPWDSAHNAALIKEMPDVFACEEAKGEGRTAILGFVGPRTAFGSGIERMKFDFEKTAASGTAPPPAIPRTSVRARAHWPDPRSPKWRCALLLAEVRPENAVPWTKPEDIPIDPKTSDDFFTAVLPSPGFWVAFADGSVRRIRTLNAKALRSLIEVGPQGNFRTELVRSQFSDREGIVLPPD